VLNYKLEQLVESLKYIYVLISVIQSLKYPCFQGMDEVNKIFPLMTVKPKVHCKLRKHENKLDCKVYEDNESCIAMAKNRQFSPRTKHIAIKYHHFRRHVNKTITLHSIDSSEQLADALTKPLEAPQFAYLRKKYSGS